MLYLTYTLNCLLMFAIPVAAAAAFQRRSGVRWPLFGWGAAAFVGSQAVRLPLLFGLTALFRSGILPHVPEDLAMPFNVVVLSLSAGIFEEGARYIVYRRFIPAARAWKEGVAFGLGHGGVEAILLGVLAGLVVVQMFALRSVDLATLPLQADQLAALQQQVEGFWTAPWYLALLGAVERVFAICLHVSLALLVLQAFTRRNRAWLFAAMGWHALVNAVGVLLLPVIGPLSVEGVLGFFALISIGVIAGLRRTRSDAAHGAEAASTGEAVSTK